MLESSTIRTKILGVSLFKSFDQFVEQWKKGDDAVDSCHTSFISNQVTHGKRRKPIVHFWQSATQFVDFLVYETLSIKRASIPCFNV